MDPDLKVALDEILAQSKKNASEIEGCERALRGFNGDVGLVAQVAWLQKSVKWIAVTLWGVVAFLLLTHAQEVVEFVDKVLGGGPPI
jgi:hypothetical protein